MMNKILLALCLMWAGVMVAEKPSTNPADYPLRVLVVSSQYVSPPGTVGYQKLDVVINGQRMELQGESGSGVLALGTYPAQSSKTGFVPKHPNGYDTFVVYRFLLPDGNMRDYDVVGIGTMPANP